MTLIILPSRLHSLATSGTYDDDDDGTLLLPFRPIKLSKLLGLEKHLVLRIRTILSQIYHIIHLVIVLFLRLLGNRKPH